MQGFLIIFSNFNIFENKKQRKQKNPPTQERIFAEK